MLAILEGRPPLPGVIRAGLPRRFDEIVLRCLEPDRQQRYQSARVLREDLEALRRDSYSGLRPGFPESGTMRPSLRQFVLAGTILLALLGAGVVLMQTPWLDREAASNPSLAVLPLRNLSPRAEEYFSDGMTAALIASLGKIGRVRVISQQSVMRYKGSEKPLPDIAKDLGVDLVLTGSALRSGQKVRITIELVQADPEEQLWTETYMRDLQDVLTLQDEVARQVAKEVRLELTAQERGRLMGARPVDPVAYDLYLQGRYHWEKRTAEALRKAIGYFERAITQDPTYAAAHAGLADAYVALATYGYESQEPALAKARAEATSALSLDPNLAEAHASLGNILWDEDNGQGERELRRAIELNPSYATAHHWLYPYLLSMGRLDEAEEHLYAARRLNPFSPSISNALALHFLFRGDIDRSIEQCRNTIELEPGFAAGHEVLWVALDAKGQTSNAFHEYERFLSLNGDPSVAALASSVFLRSGYRAALRAAGDALSLKPDQEKVELIAETFTLSGEHDKAFRWLEKGAELRMPFVLWLRQDVTWRALRGDPHFQKLLDRVERQRRARQR
jgi:TolB-like protein/Tfp pilus assembly protein PilF